MTVYRFVSEKPKLKHFFKNNDYYARVSTYRTGHTISAGHQALLTAGKDKRKASRLPHSAAKRRTFRENHFDIDLVSSPGTPYFFTLKPVAEIEPEHFAEALKALISLLKAKKAQYVYALEWAKHEQMPHIHLVANIHGETSEDLDTFATSVKRNWSKKTCGSHLAEARQHHEPVYDACGVFGYMSKQASDEFNDRAIATGKDWSVISVTGCSRGWKKSSAEAREVSREVGLDVRRGMRRTIRSRGVKLSKASKGCDSGAKRAISEVSPFTISGMSREDSRRLLDQVIDSQPLKERRYLIEMRDLYRRAHELGSQELKGEVERLLLDKGDDMRHMFPKWENPKMSMVERYNADPVFSLVCESQKVAKAAIRKSRSTVSSVKER